MFTGLIADLGFEAATIPFHQPRRKHGITHNNFLTLYDLAMLGLTNYSKAPLRLATMLGFFTPPQTGALDVSLINSDPSSGAVAIYTDRVPVIDCPRSARSGMAPPPTAVEVGLWLVVPDPARFWSEVRSHT